MLEIECIDCKINNKTQQYNVELIDVKNQKYQLRIFDSIPIGKVIRLNPFYHDFIKKDGYIKIIVKQKYEINDQPKILELEFIDFYNLSKGSIITLQDTNTLEIFKMKVDSFDNEISNIAILNLHDLEMIICSMPHYYNKYVIENWIFFK